MYYLILTGHIIACKEKLPQRANILLLPIQYSEVLALRLGEPQSCHRYEVCEGKRKLTELGQHSCHYERQFNLAEAGGYLFYPHRSLDNMKAGMTTNSLHANQ